MNLQYMQDDGSVSIVPPVPHRESNRGSALSSIYILIPTSLFAVTLDT